MRVMLTETFRTQRYVRYRAEVQKDDNKTIIVFLDIPTHAEGRRYFEEFMRALGVPVEFVEQEDNFF